MIVKYLSIVLAFSIATGCATRSNSLYQQMGGAPAIEQVVDHFIDEIQFDETIFEYFKDSDVDRFRAKMIEHLCVHTGGPCQYAGDSMLRVHAGMNINEADFNRTVDLLINAMDKAGIAHRQQNQLLKNLAPMREEIIYQ